MLQIFKGDRTKADVFMRELQIYMMVNQGVPGFKSPICRIAITLSFIKGPKVDGWVEGILNAMDQLHPVNDNIEYMYLDFLQRFYDQFADSTKQEMARVAIHWLKFKFPNIDQFISNFKTLAQKAGYTIGSTKLENIFMRGLDTAPDIMERVIDKAPWDYYDLKAKAIEVIKNCQLLRALKNANTMFLPF
jgi:hypothetical protein